MKVATKMRFLLQTVKRGEVTSLTLVRARLLCILLSLAIAQPIAAAQPQAVPSGNSGNLSAWQIDDTDPEGHLPTEAQMNASPLEAGYFLMDLAGKAERAFKGKEYSKAIKYYGALGKIAPEQSIAFSKICECYEVMGLREKAEESCREVLGKRGVTVADYERFFRLVLAQDGPLLPSDVEDLDAVIQHLQGQEKIGHLASHLKCELGVRLQNEKRLKQCTAELVKKAPDEPKTLYFQWALALQQKNYEQANRWVEQVAQQGGVPAENIERMRELTGKVVTLNSPVRKILGDWRIVSMLLASVLGLLALLNKARRRRFELLRSL